MANTKTSKATTAKKTTAKLKALVVEPKEERVVPKDIDLNEYITVRNGFQGKLVYISKRSREKFVWDDFGDKQELELRELKNARSSAKAFFENNWFMFDEEDMWVIDYLGVSKYYENAVAIDEFDEIFESTPTKVKEIIGKMSKGQANSLAYRARTKVLNGEIDSRKLITALEEALGIELIEK